MSFATGLPVRYRDLSLNFYSLIEWQLYLVSVRQGGAELPVTLPCLI